MGTETRKSASYGSGLLMSALLGGLIGAGVTLLLCLIPAGVLTGAADPSTALPIISLVLPAVGTLVAAIASASRSGEGVIAGLLGGVCCLAVLFVLSLGMRGEDCRVEPVGAALGYGLSLVSALVGGLARRKKPVAVSGHRSPAASARKRLSARR